MTAWVSRRARWIKKLVLRNGDLGLPALPQGRAPPAGAGALSAVAKAMGERLRDGLEGMPRLAGSSSSGGASSDGDDGDAPGGPGWRPSHTFEERGFSPLFAALPSLEHLEVIRCGRVMTSGALPALSALSRLSHLELRGCSGRLHPPHLSFLPGLTALRHLALATAAGAGPGGEDDGEEGADEYGLAAVPPCVWELTQLTHLDLSGHLFLDHLPAAVSRLAALECLVVRDSSLAAQRELSSLSRLTRLDLGVNPLVGDALADDQYDDLLPADGFASSEQEDAAHPPEEDQPFDAGRAYRSDAVLDAIRGAVAAAGAAGAPPGAALAARAWEAAGATLSGLGLDSFDGLGITFPSPAGLGSLRVLDLGSCNVSALPVHLCLFTGLERLGLRSNGLGGVSHASPTHFTGLLHADLSWVGDPADRVAFARQLYGDTGAGGWGGGGEPGRGAPGAGRAWPRRGDPSLHDEMALARAWRRKLARLLPLAPALLPRLTEVDLSNNLLCVVPDALVGLPALERLDLSHNPLQVLHPRLLSGNPALAVVGLEGNPPVLAPAPGGGGSAWRGMLGCEAGAGAADGDSCACCGVRLRAGVLRRGRAGEAGAGEEGLAGAGEWTGHDLAEHVRHRLALVQSHTQGLLGGNGAPA